MIRKLIAICASVALLLLAGCSKAEDKKPPTPVEIVSYTQIDEHLSVRLRNPNSDVGLVRSPFELTMIDESGGIIGVAGQGGLAGAPINTIYQLPPKGDFGLDVDVPKGSVVKNVKLTVLGTWFDWDIVGAAKVTVSDQSVRPDPGFSGPTVTGRIAIDKPGPFNIRVIAFVKTPQGVVVSSNWVDCVKQGDDRAFETQSFGSVRGPYELDGVVAYQSAVPDVGPQYVPTCPA
ncbi:hypothetical protein [Smaragdicoccus niigatensis]|uniref:hypothetical protein n=1 Tax=Smaragdicoccus niigatensis TaxID=359359 RepID=UPI00035E31A2|nr:hypothetical protein [Smaragdicoccus niigatensis]